MFLLERHSLFSCFILLFFHVFSLCFILLFNFRAFTRRFKYCINIVLSSHTLCWHTSHTLCWRHNVHVQKPYKVKQKQDFYTFSCSFLALYIHGIRVMKHIIIIILWIKIEYPIHYNSLSNNMYLIANIR